MLSLLGMIPPFLALCACLAAKGRVPCASHWVGMRWSMRTKGKAAARSRSPTILCEPLRADKDAIASPHIIRIIAPPSVPRRIIFANAREISFRARALTKIHARLEEFESTGGRAHARSACGDRRYSEEAAGEEEVEGFERAAGMLARPLLREREDRERAWLIQL